MFMMLMNNMNNQQPQRMGMLQRMAERRQARRAAMHHNDPVTQLMEAWMTPYAAPGTTLRMPARNAYPFGHFGVQASPINTANYGGFHNLHFGHTTFPGMQ